MATLTNMDGTSGSDVLTYDKGGTGVVFHTKAGNDKVTIKDGAISIINEGGADSILIQGGSGHNIEGAGSSVENITINGGNAVEAQLGDGKDTIVLMASNGRKATGGSSSIRGGGWTDTFTTNDGVQNYQLYGDAGDDVFNINGGKNMNFWGGAANDTFVVKGGTNNKLYGGDSADNFEIYAANQNMILGYGNDIVNIYQGDNQQIKGNLGINTINLMAGSGHVITADIDQAASKKAGKDVGYGQDKVYISGTASNITANLGDGKDVVEVSSGSKHQIFTEGWGDSIVISGTTSDSTFDAGAGDDTINVSGGSNNEVLGGEGSDKFELTGGTDNRVYGGEGKDIFTITDGSNNMVSGGEGNDTFTISGGSNNIVEGGTGNDTITISGGSNNIVEGGTGNDTYNIQWGKIEQVIIDNRSAGDADKDSLVLDKAETTDFNYSIDAGTLVMTDVVTGKTIKVVGWDESKGMQHVFSDKTLGWEEIEALTHVLQVVQNGSYNVGTVNKVKLLKDLDQVELTQVNTPIVIDVTSLSAGNYGIGYDMTDEGVVVKLHDLNQENNPVVKTLEVKGSQAEHISLNIPLTTGVTTVALDDIATDNNIWDLTQLKYVGWNVDLGDTSGTEDTLYEFKGGLGDDTITSNGATQLQIREVMGDNHITVTNGDSVIVTTEKGQDTIILDGGARNHVLSGADDDTITVNGGSNHTVDGGAGNDTIIINDGSNHTVDGGEGNDYFTINGGTNHTLEGGAGNDTYNVNWNKVKSITLDSRSAGLGDQDRLVLSQAKSTDFNYYTLGSTLYMSEVQTSKRIKVLGWKEAAGMQYVFTDTTLDFAAIEALTKVLQIATKSGSYDVGDAETVKLIKDIDEIALYGTNKPLSIEVTGIPVGNYGIGYDQTRDGVLVKLHDLAQENNPVVKTIKIKGTPVEQISVTVPVSNGMSTVALSSIATDNNIWDMTQLKYAGWNVDLGNTSGTSSKPYVFTGGLGDDTITSTGGSYVEITELVGNNTINITDGTNNRAYGGGGNDTISASGSDKLDIYGGEGNDTITVNDGTNNRAYGGKGDDTFTITGGSNHLVDGGSGHDIYNIHWGEIQSLTIDNRSAEAADQDKLVLEGAASSDFRYVIQGGTLVMTELLTGNSIRVLGWNEAEAMKYTFKDTTLDLAGLETLTHLLQVSQAGTYDIGTVDKVKLLKDMDQVELTGVNKALVIDGTGLSAGNYGIGYDRTEEGIVIKLHDLDQENNPVVKTIVVKGTQAEQVSLTLPLINGMTTVALQDIATDNNIWDLTQLKYVGWTVELENTSGTAGNPYVFKSGLGDDTITLSGGFNVQIMETGGNNNITVNNGTNVVVYGNAGNDSITINGGTDNLMAGGAGNDTYTINNLMAGQRLTIDNGSNGSGETDSLVLKDYDWEEFKTVVVGNTVTLTHREMGAVITLLNYKPEEFVNIQFKDVILSGEELLKDPRLLVIEDGLDHEQEGFLIENKQEAKEYQVILKDGNVTTLQGVEMSGGLIHNNRLTVEGGTVGTLYGVKSTGGLVSDNMVEIHGGQAGEIFGAYGQQSDFTGNILTIDGGTVKSVTGVRITGTNSNNYVISGNKIYLSGNAVVNGVVQAAAGGQQSDNEVHIGGNACVMSYVRGGFIIGSQNLGKVYLEDNARVKGNIYAEEVIVSGGVAESRIQAPRVEVMGGTIKTIEANDVEVTGGTIQEIDGTEGKDTITVSNGSIGSISAGAGDDSITIRDSSISLINAGAGDDAIEIWNMNSGDYFIDGGTGSDIYMLHNLKTGNSFIIYNVEDESEDREQLYLQNYNSADFIRYYTSSSYSEQIDGEWVTRNTKDFRLVHKTTGAKISLKDWFDSNKNNEIIFAHETITDSGSFNNSKTRIINNSADNGSVLFKNVANGNVEGYSLILENGTVYDFTCAGVTAGTGSNNTVVIYNGTIQNNVFGTYGYTSDSGVKANINNTTVTVLGGEIGGHIRSADATNGKSTNNTITVGGAAVVQGNIYQSRGSDNTATDNMGTITITDTAQVKGMVYGGAGIDTVTISGNAKVATVSMGTGNDTFILKDKASVDKVDLGAGNNTFYLYGGTLGNMTWSGGACNGHFSGIENVNFNMSDYADKIYVEAGKDITVNAGNGNDTIYVSGGEDVKVYGGIGNDYNDNDPTSSYYSRGSDTFYISGGTRVFADGGSQNDTFTITGGKEITVQAGLGDDIINVAGGEDITVSGGIGTDYKNDDPSTGSYNNRGYDTINISAGKRIFADGGSQNDTFTITGGSDIIAQGNAGNDTFNISGGSNITLYGGIGDDASTKGGIYWRGQDSFYISGGTDITANGGGDDDYFEVSGGDQVTLFGSAGNDTYKFTALKAGGQYTIDLKDVYNNYMDLIDFSAFNKEDFTISNKGNDIIMTHTNGGQVTIKGWLGNRTNAHIKFNDGRLLDKEYFVDGTPEVSVVTQADVIKSFMTGLNYSQQSGVEALDEAVIFSSAGRYTSFNALLSEFKSTISSCNINSATDADRFYQQYCGIILGNADTGAITGADCGGPVVKTADSIVEEAPGLTLSDFVLDRSNRITAYDYDTKTIKEFYATEVNGLTLYWDDAEWESLAGRYKIDVEYLEQMMAGVIKAWADPSINLIRDSYGMSLTDACSELQTLADGTRGLQVQFEYLNDKNWLAYVSNNRDLYNVYEKMVINLRYYTNGVLDVNGKTSTQGNLDRTIAHELVHGTMAANIYEFNKLPCYIKEGLAELVHGIDDERNYTMKNWIQENKYNMDYLFDTSHTSTTSDKSHEYTGGYTLLRYFAKQVYDYANAGSAMVADSLMETAMMEQGFEELMNATLDFENGGALAAADLTWEQEEKNKTLVFGNAI